MLAANAPSGSLGTTSLQANRVTASFPNIPANPDVMAMPRTVCWTASRSEYNSVGPGCHDGTQAKLWAARQQRVAPRSEKRLVNVVPSLTAHLQPAMVAQLTKLSFRQPAIVALRPTGSDHAGCRLRPNATRSQGRAQRLAVMNLAAEIIGSVRPLRCLVVHLPATKLSSVPVYSSPTAYLTLAYACHEHVCRALSRVTSTRPQASALDAARGGRLSCVCSS
jgi:hypothetical protein